ncbi:MAG: MBL fold metallo-hydrolase [Bacteroidia bacterium]
MKRKILKTLKWLGLGLLVIILLVSIIAALFMNFSPQFGGEVSEEQEAEYALTGHYADGIFLNDEEIIMQTDCHSIKKMIGEMFEPDPRVSPKTNIEVIPFDVESIGSLHDSLARITWLGHSSFLIEMAGKTILLDPIFGQYAAPHSLLGRKRYNSEMPFKLESLDHIDAVIISHDHYDHLDYPTINTIKAKTKQFFVPLGVDNHLRSWGITDANIEAMDWWNETALGDINIAFTPSRHMSGRAMGDQSATLWGSWVLSSPRHNFYFSGDGGYGKHFKAIGEQYGPFDIGLMECGQYNELWANVHMMPEQTVQAGKDVGARLIMPIHWGSFTLATHAWTDPVERVTEAAKALALPITTPQIGESVVLPGHAWPTERWWEQVD